MITLRPLDVLNDLMPPLFRGFDTETVGASAEIFGKYADRHREKMESYLKDWTGKDDLDVQSYVKNHKEEAEDASNHALYDLVTEVQLTEGGEAADDLLCAGYVLGRDGMYKVSLSGAGKENGNGGAPQGVSPQQYQNLQNAMANYSQQA